MTEQEYMDLLQRGYDTFKAVYEDWQLEAGAGHWQEAEDWLEDAKRILDKWAELKK